MDRWAWEQLDPWTELRRKLPLAPSLGYARARPVAGRAPRPRSARSCIASRSRRAFAAGLRHTKLALPRRCGDVTRGDPPAGHTAPARACRSRGHLCVPARDRQHRDYPRGPRAGRHRMRPPAQRSAAESASASGHRRWCLGPAARASGTPRSRPTARRQPVPPTTGFCVRRGICKVFATRHPCWANTAPASRRRCNGASWLGGYAKAIVSRRRAAPSSCKGHREAQSRDCLPGLAAVSVRLESRDRGRRWRNGLAGSRFHETAGSGAR